MTNNMEAYCKYCKENTLFLLESDLLWHCDECGNILDSVPEDEFEEYEDDMEQTIIRCPHCGSIFGIDEVVMEEDEMECPICFDDITDYVGELRDSLEEEDEEWF